MRASTRSVIALTALPTLLAAAPAGAATVAVPPCVVDAGLQRTVPVIATGFPPGALVRLAYTHPSFGASATGTGVADAAGNFALTNFPAPFRSSRTREGTFGLVATDTRNPSA